MCFGVRSLAFCLFLAVKKIARVACEHSKVGTRARTLLVVKLSLAREVVFRRDAGTGAGSAGGWCRGLKAHLLRYLRA